MTGLPAELTGTTTPFEGMGRELGYPTANFASDTDVPDGVYFGWADLASYGHHPAMIFVGTPTTVGAKRRRVEAHLLDIVDRDYYGKELTVMLEHFHRRNHTFDSVEKLLEAMNRDEVAAREWFSTQ